MIDTSLYDSMRERHDEEKAAYIRDHCVLGLNVPEEPNRRFGFTGISLYCDAEKMDGFQKMMRACDDEVAEGMKSFQFAIGAFYRKMEELDYDDTNYGDYCIINSLCMGFLKYDEGMDYYDFVRRAFGFRRIAEAYGIARHAYLYE